jgi:hypothetical protein
MREPTTLELVFLLLFSQRCERRLEDERVGGRCRGVGDLSWECARV